MISVFFRTPRSFVFPVARGECLELAAALLDALQLEADELELCLVDDVEMSELHERHLGGIGPTNVLAFPNEAPDETLEQDACAAFAEEYADEDLEWDEAPDGPELFPEAFSDFADPFEEEDFDTVVSGSIVFSVDALRRESLLYGQDPHEYFTRLLAHALLHLTGVPHGGFMEERMDFAVAQVLA